MHSLANIADNLLNNTSKVMLVHILKLMSANTADSLKVHLISNMKVHSQDIILLTGITFG